MPPRAPPALSSPVSPLSRRVRRSSRPSKSSGSTSCVSVIASRSAPHWPSAACRRSNWSARCCVSVCGARHAVDGTPAQHRQQSHHRNGDQQFDEREAAGTAHRQMPGVTRSRVFRSRGAVERAWPATGAVPPRVAGGGDAKRRRSGVKIQRRPAPSWIGHRPAQRWSVGAHLIPPHHRGQHQQPHRFTRRPGLPPPHRCAGSSGWGWARPPDAPPASGRPGCSRRWSRPHRAVWRARRSRVSSFSAHSWASHWSLWRLAARVRAPVACRPAARVMATTASATSTSIRVKPWLRRVCLMAWCLPAAPQTAPARRCPGSGDGHPAAAAIAVRRSAAPAPAPAPQPRRAA